MDKPTYRYNHKTGKLDRTYRINSDVVVIPGFVDPGTGIPKSFVYKGLMGKGEQTLQRLFNLPVTIGAGSGG